MKTTTYLRWSLLIPFVVWGLCLLLFALMSEFSRGLLNPIENMGFTDALTLFLASYVFGVIIWIFPYLFLTLILFLWSFIGRARTMLNAFALSPIAMALLTIAVVIIMELGGNSGGVLNNPNGTLNRLGGFDNWSSIILVFVGIALVWGYICVGIGYGLYRFLKHREIIRDEEILPAPQSA